MKKFEKLIILLVIILAATLRFYNLGSNPPGLYWDEVAFGYDAYSILKTAHDHHGNFMPLFFESFGDWKLPVYFYLLVPSIAVIGLNELAVRFPSAIFGVLTVGILYLFIKKITKNLNLAFLSAFFLAISPWHVQFSRGGFESTVGLFFVVLGLYFFFLAQENKKQYFYAISFVSFVVSMYSYHAYRIFTPLLVIILSFLFFDKIRSNYRKMAVPFLLAFALFLPLLNFTFSKEGKARAISQSSFSKAGYEVSRINYDQKSKRPLRFLSKYWRPPLYYASIAAESYLEHFSPIFLFVRGDQTGRHSQVDMGQIYIFEGIFALASIFALKNINKNTKKLMLSVLLISPIPAVIVNPSPHAYRTLQMSLPLAFFSALGADYIFSKIRIFQVKTIIIIVVFYVFISYLHLLFVHYPRKFSADWQDGYSEMVAKIHKHQKSYDKIYVTNINQVPYIYMLFYLKYDPQKFIDSRGSRETFDKYFFVNPDQDLYHEGKILYVAPSWQKMDGIFLDGVNDSNGRHIYSLWEIK